MWVFQTPFNSSLLGSSYVVGTVQGAFLNIAFKTILQDLHIFSFFNKQAIWVSEWFNNSSNATYLKSQVPSLKLFYKH